MARMREALRGALAHPLVLALVLLGATLYLLPALRPNAAEVPAAEVSWTDELPVGGWTDLDSIYESHLANVQLAEREVKREPNDSALARSLEEFREQLASLERARAATSLREGLLALADYEDGLAASMGMSGSACARAEAAQFRAVAALDDPVFYEWPQEMPALVYATSNQYVLTQGAIALGMRWLLGTSWSYDGSLDFVLWIVPLAAACLVGTSAAWPRSRRGVCRRSARNAVVRTVAVGAAAGLIAAALVTLPALAAAAARNGVGDLLYPVVFMSSTTSFTVTTVTAVVLQRAMVLAGVAVCVSMLGVASRALTHCVAPAAIVVAAAVVTAAQADWFSFTNPLRDLASLLPITYLDPARATGSHMGMLLSQPATSLPGVVPATGVVTLAATAALLSSGVGAVRVAMRTAVRWRDVELRGDVPRWWVAARATLCGVVTALRRCPRTVLPGDPLAHGPPACATAYRALPPARMGAGADVLLPSYVLLPRPPPPFLHVGQV